MKVLGHNAGLASGHMSRALLVASHVLLVFDHLPIQM
jgi:hypothetical protein